MTRSGYSPWRTAMARRTYVSAILWIAGSVWAWLAHAPDPSGWLRLRLDGPGLLLLASALIGGLNFFPKGVRAVARLRLDMNFLMTAAIVGALLIGEPIEAAAIAALFSLAELLEAAAVARTSRSIEELIELAPERARRVTPDGREEEVPTAELRQGDRLRVRPGQKIPIDGIVLDGVSAIDEANVTGESVPVRKDEGDTVLAGTLLVEGYLEIRATTDAGNTTLDRIVRLVREAQSRRSPSERFIERFARYYTPAVTILAVQTMIVPPLAGLGSSLDWFTRGLTLLVIACPCALVIATPVTIMSAITSAARHGVLIKGGEYIESLGATGAVAFDKTGSLTEGRFSVTNVEGIDGTEPREVLRIASDIERRSEHPIARAITEHADAELPPSATQPSVSEFEAKPGYGVLARLNGRRVRIGTPELFPDIEPPRRLDELRAEGKTSVLVGVDDHIIGIIALADGIRPDAPEVIRELRRLGVHDIVMVTGDHERVAHRVASELGIQDVRAQLLPEEKVEVVGSYRREHHRVAMLGDGVNDAPALATADVGIAMGGAGSPASIETADVALLADDLRMLPYAVHLARRARWLLRFNIYLAIGVKLLLAIGAVAGVVSLLIAVLVGDLGASLAVTLNAMRLARLKPVV
jgi:Cd2+/Zn2+-exporting ATPase